MRQKTKSLVVTFAATSDAMAMEKYCLAHRLPGRLIPVPREISAGCGLAWKTAPEEKDNFTRALTDAGIRWQAMEILEMWG